MTIAAILPYLVPLLSAAAGYLLRHIDLFNAHGPVPPGPAPTPNVPTGVKHPLLDMLGGAFIPLLNIFLHTKAPVSPAPVPDAAPAFDLQKLLAILASMAPQQTPVLVQTTAPAPKV